MGRTWLQTMPRRTWRGVFRWRTCILLGPRRKSSSATFRTHLEPSEVFSWPASGFNLNFLAQEVVAPSQKGSLSFEDVTHIVEEINEHYGRWHDESDCADMKSVLLNMEGKCPGRVDLSRFYSASLYEDRWQFSESASRLQLRGEKKRGRLNAAQVHYLRDLGALDESQPESSVIVSNYVLGASNCVGTSRFYAQCCVDPCDQLMELRPKEDVVAVQERRVESLQPR